MIGWAVFEIRAIRFVAARAGVVVVARTGLHDAAQRDDTWPQRSLPHDHRRRNPTTGITNM